MLNETFTAPDATAELFAMVVATDGFVCGIGASPELALADAARSQRSLDPQVIYDLKPCSKDLLVLFRERGGDISYEEVGGVLRPMGLDPYY